MFRTFSLKGTKDGLEIKIKDTGNISLLYSEIENCFQLPENQMFPILSIQICGENLSPLIAKTIEHLILKASLGRMTPKAETLPENIETQDTVSLQKSVRSGECQKSKSSLIINGNVNSGGVIQAEGWIIVLGHLFGTAIVPEKQKIYIGRASKGQIRIGKHVYFPNVEKDGVWIYERDGKLYLEDYGGKKIYG